jgi:cytochrome c biogenesis protein CcdA
MIVAFARYSRDRGFAVLAKHPRFVITLALGSIAGTFLGGRLLGAGQASALLPVLAAIILLSAEQRPLDLECRQPASINRGCETSR